MSQTRTTTRTTTIGRLIVWPSDAAKDQPNRVPSKRRGPQKVATLRWLSVLGFLLCLGGSSAVATEGGSSYSGRLKGRVTDAHQQPLAGIELELQDMLTSPRPAGQRVQTNADGRYEFSGLFTSAYTVSIQNDSYLFEFWDNQRCLGGEDCYYEPNLIGVVDGEDTDGIDFVLDRPASITFDNGGAPGYFQTRLFDSQGNVVESNMGRLWPGTYYALIEHGVGIDELFGGIPCPGFIDTTDEVTLGEDSSMCDVTEGDPIELQEGEHRVISMPARPGAEISATVVAADTGETLQAHIEVWDGSGRSIVNSFGNRQSWVKDLPPGDYNVTAHAPYQPTGGFVTQLYPDLPCPLGPPIGCDPALGAKIQVTGQEVVEIVFVVERDGAIGITVVEEGLADPIYYDWGVKVWDAEGRVLRSDEEGTGSTSVDDLPAGNYFVAVYPTEGFGQALPYRGEFSDGRPCNEHLPGGCEPSGVPAVTVVPGQVTPVVFSLSPFAQVSGTVTNDTRKSVEVWNLEGELVTSRLTDGSGEFSINRLPPGGYRLSTRPSQLGSNLGIDELYSGIACDGGPGIGCDLEDGDILSVPLAQNIEGVDFNLDPGGAIVGSVQVAATSLPASLVRIEATDLQGHPMGSTLTTVSSEGEYRLSGLSSGSYLVKATSRNPAFPEHLYGIGPCGDCERQPGDLVEVVLGQDTSGIDFELESRTAICAKPGTACLLDNRFLIEGSLTHPENDLEFEIEAMHFPGSGRAESQESVFFESFNPGNFELAVKMVDACLLPDNDPLRSFWVFIGGLTNAQTKIDIEDTVTGEVLTWQNPRGEFPKSYANTAAFDCDTGGIASCSRTDEVACLLGSRFRVSGSMEDFAEPPVVFPTRVMSFPESKAVSRQAAFFEAFSEGTFELGVKMVDGCDLPSGHPWRGYWVFYGGLTNTETLVAVTQLQTGAIDRWTIEPGTLPRSEGRIAAFDCE